MQTFNERSDLLAACGFEVHVIVIDVLARHVQSHWM